METKRIKLVSAEYNEETGESKSVINTPLGTFTGVSKIHPEDRDFSSKFFGCRIAELRASRQYCLALARDYRAKVKALEDFFCQMMNTRAFDSNAYYVRQLEKTRNEYKEKAAHWKTQAARIKEVIREDIVARDVYIAEQRKAAKNNA
jgi:hypothetical protein